MEDAAMTPSLLWSRPVRRQHRPAAGFAAALLLATLAGCNAPPPPDKERPPEPQAATRHTELRDAIQAPIERAEQVEADTLKAAEAQRAAIEAATGG
jgi:hypothetical protein